MPNGAYEIIHPYRIAVNNYLQDIQDDGVFWSLYQEQEVNYDCKGLGAEFGTFILMELRNQNQEGYTRKRG